MILVMASDFDNLEDDLSGFLRTGKEYANETVIYMTCVNNQPVIFANGGETKVNLSRSLANIKTIYPVTSVIGIGNGASLNQEKGNVGDIFLCESSLQYDVNFMPLGHAQGVVPELSKAIFNSSSELTDTAKTACNIKGLDCMCGKAISADRFVAFTIDSKQLKDEFNADFIDTESGTLGELAYICKIPFAIIKGISNFADDNAVIDYREYKNKANLNSLNVTLNVLDLLTK